MCPSLPAARWCSKGECRIRWTAIMEWLAYPIFEPTVSKAANEEDIFYGKRGGPNARGVYNEEGFVVLKGSLARRDAALSSHNTIETRREELVASGVLSAIMTGYIFERDWVSATPSAAAAIVSGGSANGWIERKNRKGHTLDDVYRRASKG